MTNAQHTPGPWRIIKGETQYDFIIASKSDPEQSGLSLDNRVANGVMIEDARLIAAAPELLEAAKLQILALRVEYDEAAKNELWESGWKNQTGLTAMEYAECLLRAAIIKAEGK